MLSTNLCNKLIFREENFALVAVNQPLIRQMHTWKWQHKIRTSMESLFQSDMIPLTV